MNVVNFIKKLFSPSEQFKGVRPAQVYILKLFFFLMFVFAAKDAWTELLNHHGDWDPEIAIAWCSIAAYTTLSGLGIFHTLKMLPIMLFMIFYKGLWLFFVAYPLWSNGQLVGSEAAGWVEVFALMIIPVVFMPWSYVFKTFVLGKG